MNYADTHKSIIEDCKKGNRKAQFELYSLYSKAMYNICLRMIKDELDAEDILQNSFVDVFSKLHSFKHQSSIGAWIKRIVINNCINYLKKRRLEIAEWQPHFAETISIKEAEMPSLHYNVQSVNHAIQQLPDGYRVVFNLYMMEGYDHKEIGEILSISEATSKSQYSRAKKKVREILVTQSIR